MSEASELLLWGIVVHLVCDWPLQNDWMAHNKVSLRHPAAYVHAGIHGLGMLLVFAWPAAVVIATTHLLIDTRKPIIWWSKLIGQKQPQNRWIGGKVTGFAIYDLGLEVRIWTDQVAHVAAVAAVALVVA